MQNAGWTVMADHRSSKVEILFYFESGSWVAVILPARRTTHALWLYVGGHLVQYREPKIEEQRQYCMCIGKNDINCSLYVIGKWLLACSFQVMLLVQIKITIEKTQSRATSTRPRMGFTWGYHKRIMMPATMKPLLVSTKWYCRKKILAKIIDPYSSWYFQITCG